MTKKILSLVLSMFLVFFPIINQINAEELDQNEQISTITNDREEAIDLGLTQEMEIINVNYHNEPINDYKIVVKDLESNESKTFELKDKNTLTLYLANRRYSITEKDNHIKESIIDLSDKARGNILKVYTKTLPKSTSSNTTTPSSSTTETTEKTSTTNTSLKNTDKTTVTSVKQTSKKDVTTTGVKEFSIIGGIILVSVGVSLVVNKKRKGI